MENTKKREEKLLEEELLQIDIKFSPPSDRINKPSLDFFLRICGSEALEFEPGGLAIHIARYAPDIFGRTGTASSQNIYPFSFDGWTEARKEGIILVKELYRLPEQICIVEFSGIPKPKEIFDYDKLYRIKVVDLLSTTYLFKGNVDLN